MSMTKALLAASALIVGGAAYADEIGMADYQQYCATCHGVDATGGGDLTQLMTVKVPDLTQIAANNDGIFPMLDVIHVIDGRTGVRAHGGPMPVYGRVFTAEAAEHGTIAAALEARGRVLSIAYYLESLQQ
ncbi:cytochrome c [Alphaproteobacteria bacterium GH1-50]|uniref:Cytochrome c n=1 Tax=Kangsaoukella pontilimi TaxID=2691042 RepID=A0A7C9MYG1_9RHOB|nr:cytochrome c [Kangsaoukella pontilimi]MXQ09114.1 cytochrome c [Kangsaoukella pontilimi]